MLKRSILMALLCAGLSLLVYSMTRDSGDARAGERQAKTAEAVELTAVGVAAFETCSPIALEPTCEIGTEVHAQTKTAP